MATASEAGGRPMKIPGPDHPITIEEAGERVVVKVRGRVIADTSRALTLRESSYPPVRYIPREDVDMAALAPSQRETYCPYKGACHYFSIPDGGTRSVDAVWTYEDPYPAVDAIRGYLAFYPDRVDTMEIAPGH